MKSQVRGKSFFYILLVVTSLLCLSILWPFISVIIISAALAVVLNPIFEWIRVKIFNKKLPSFAAGLTVIIFICILGIPLGFIGTEVVIQAKSIYISLANNGSASEYINKISSTIDTFIPSAAVIDLNIIFKSILSFISDNIGGIFSATLNTGLSIFLIILSLFYFLRDGDRWKKYLIVVSPLPDVHDERILSMLGRAVNGVMKGYILIAIIQGILISIGMYIFGVPNAVLWGVIAAIASLIPTIGTSLVSIPTIIYLLVTGDIFSAIGFAVWSAILVGTIDNLLNPVIMGKNIELPPITVLFGVLGGITLFGAAGILIGPLEISLFYTLIRIYHEDFQAKS